jgi:hypothetical protein
MNKKQAISYIESLFPIDSEYSNTNAVGKLLLFEAIENVGWRKLSDEILVEYAQLCIDEDARQAIRALNKLGGR